MCVNNIVKDENNMSLETLELLRLISSKQNIDKAICEAAKVISAHRASAESQKAKSAYPLQKATQNRLSL